MTDIKEMKEAMLKELREIKDEADQLSAMCDAFMMDIENCINEQELMDANEKYSFDDFRRIIEVF